MSTYYNVKEHLIAKNTRKDSYTALNEAVESMRFQLAKLGALLLLDLADVDHMNLTADGRHFSFTGKAAADELHKMLRALEEAEHIDFEAEYGFWIYGSYSNWEVGPFLTADCFEATVKQEPESACDFLYTMYSKCDSESGAGKLCAFGTQNGTLPCGVITPEITEIPDDGVWVAEDTSVVFDDDISDKMDVGCIAQCAQAFMQLGADVDFSSQTSSLYVNSITLQSRKDFEQFINICADLDKATDSHCSFLADFVDLSGKDARVLSIDFGSNPTPIVTMAAV